MKKKLDLQTVILLVVSIIAVALVALLVTTSLLSKKSIVAKELELDDAKFQIEQLQTRIQELGETTQVYRVTKDVKSGERCIAEYLETAEVPAAMAEGYDVELEDILGKYFLVDVAKGATITKESVYDKVLKNDDRFIEVICDRKVAGFSKGDTVDVRITCPDGQDYLLLDSKLVEDVYGNVVRIVADEKDLLIYNGAEADWSRYYKNADLGTSMRIYCTEHVNAGTQSTIRNYPIANVLPDGETFDGSVLWTALHDLNLSESDLADWLKVDRAKFEKSLEYYDQYRTITYTDTITIVDADQKTRKVEVEYTEDSDLRTAVNEAYPGSRIICVVSSDSKISVDLRRGSAAVAKAKEYRNEIYNDGIVAYNEREAAIREAKYLAAQNGEEYNEEYYDQYILQKKLDENEQKLREGDGSIH